MTALVVVAIVAWRWAAQSGPAPAPTAAAAGGGGAAAGLELTDKQLAAIRIARVEDRVFPVEREAVGNIDFDEDQAVQAYPPYAGRIREVRATLGDRVTKGQVLYTIESPDLVQAESTLIATAGVLELTTHALNRARELWSTQGIAQKDLDQAVSDQQAADAAHHAARNAVRVFGKSDGEIEALLKTREVEPVLVVRSPIAGRVTARNAAPGLYVQPGAPPAPIAVADPSRMWMIANVAEIEAPALAEGQRVRVRVPAYPHREFEGRLEALGSSVDPATHRLVARASISDPRHELRAGMLAAFRVETGVPRRSAAVPVGGVVREGDGTMTVWVTTDRRRFTQRAVDIGARHDGYDEIIAGLKVGEYVATDGALFLDNAAHGSGAD